MGDQERLDVLDSDGNFTGVSELRSTVHKKGYFHRAVHVWIFSESSQQLLVQKRSNLKDSWPNLWDISSAGHISANDSSLRTAVREVEEELGLTFPENAFEYLFEYLHVTVLNDGQYINNEFDDVYLITVVDPIPIDHFTLQEEEVSEVKWIHYTELEKIYFDNHSLFVPIDMNGNYKKLFDVLKTRFSMNTHNRETFLANQLQKYAAVNISADLSNLSENDVNGLKLIIKAAKILDELFLEQIFPINSLLLNHLKENAEKEDTTKLEKLLHKYFLINKSAWCELNESKPFLSTFDSSTMKIQNYSKNLNIHFNLFYKLAIPTSRPLGANFYPSDLKKDEFNLWIKNLTELEKENAKQFFTVIRRPKIEKNYHLNQNNDHKSMNNGDSNDKLIKNDNDLEIIPYNKEYFSYLERISVLLQKASDLVENESLKNLLLEKSKSFLNNNFSFSDKFWLKLDSSIDLTIGPYEIYEDKLFGFKASFECFVGICDIESTKKLKYFSENLQYLEDNIPLNDEYKSKINNFSPIRVVNLLYNSGDVKGPQTMAFNLPNDEKIKKENGSAMVILSNISKAKFEKIVIPISQILISEEQQIYVNFESFFTHILCHEICHSLGPKDILIVHNQRKSSVRKELEELYSCLEEAKADILGLWSIIFLIKNKGFLSKDYIKPIYTSFLSSCFRSIRFGLNEAHGMGQAIQFNWLLEKKAIQINSNSKYSINFSQIEAGLESLCREILTIQAEGDKGRAKRIVSKFGMINEELKVALDKIKHVPVDIAPEFEVLSKLNL